MLKQGDPVKTFEDRAASALRELLEQVPATGPDGVELSSQEPDSGIDILAHVSVAGRPQVLACQVKANGQPRNVRMSLQQLRNLISHGKLNAIPIVIAPYLSPEAQALCRDHGAGFLDLEGNARIVFDGVFIERRVASRPPAERRELKSIFKPKSAQVLRVMLRDPQKAWRVADLAGTANVSLGHVSNVRAALLDREWAAVGPDGLSLIKPDALLDAWRDAYEPPTGERLGFYTTLHGSSFEEAARKVLGASGQDGGAMLASYSAALWLAPYARTASQFFYADDIGLDRLHDALKLSPARKGENVFVTLPRDPGLFRDSVEPAPGIICTSPVQTYLDLTAAGERGREAADHLRQEKLTWRR
jgi:hypothetical protein